MSPRPKSVGEALKRARRKKGLTQFEVGTKAGLGANTYPRLERNDHVPSIETLKKLKKVLDIDVAEILSLL